MSRTSLYSFPPTPQDWLQIQDVVRAYYVNQKLPLKEVRIVLRDRHGFRATDRMIKARLKQWGYLKNAKKEDWHFLALLHQRRKERGKLSTVFDVRGHRKTVKDLQRFIRNQNMTVEQFLDEARDSTGGKQIPEYIQALTPDSRHYNESQLDDVSPDYLTPSPPQTAAQLNYHQDVSGPSNFSHFSGPTNHNRSRSVSASSNEQALVGGFSRIHHSLQPPIEIQDSAYISGSSSALSCTQLQMEFEMLSSQVTRPAPLLSRFGDEDISSWAMLSSSPSSSEKSSSSTYFVCSRCNQPSDQHFFSLDNFEPHQAVRRDILNGDDHTLHLPISTKDEGSWLWVSRCFLACMCLSKGDHAAAEQSLREAANEFERLLGRKDRQLLIAAGLVMTVLHQHNQGEITQKVLDSAQQVCERLLAEDHAIRMTIRYLTISANISQKEHGITSAYMKTICDKFLDYLPPDHEYVIAARYNYAWMLKFEGEFAASEAEAREVHKISCRVLGKIHMQSVTCLAVIAGCIWFNDERIDECIAIFTELIHQASQSVGRHHPYTLEAKRRLATKLEKKSGQSVETLRLYKDVVLGRAHMLGPTHTYTIGAREAYEEQLQQMNLWNDPSGLPSKQQCEVQDVFSPNSPGSWTKISRGRTSSQRSTRRPFKNELLDPEMDEDDDLVLVDGREAGSMSPRSLDEFKAY
ncbi:hypothetical protein LTR64_001854 [Lithohypha guttulata]|uniref:uncharacterized protein n=1 Tax=Lithohypha guttulata TaxID=1690604 RepID=UPI002DDEE469|nr:hypothetical protein LTR51_007713 [Lithohypha guttulata]